MSDRTFMRALHTQLATLSHSPQPQIDWRNGTWTDTDGTSYDGEFKPKAGTAFLRPFYLPAGNIPISTNPVQHRSEIIYQVNCAVSERGGDDEAYALAEAVRALFFPLNNEPNSLTAGAYTLHINRKPDFDPLPAQGGFTGVAVLVRCFALT